MIGTYTHRGELYRAGRRIWTAADDATLRRLYPDMPTVRIARRLRRSLTATYARARLLGIPKSAAYLASPHACRLRRGDHVGRRFWYPKGHVPANKGLRRPGYGPGRMKATQFKAGAPSGNTMPIGSTRLIEGYLYRKISDVPKVPYTVNWKAEHILLWTVAARLPLPRGHVLVFRNGDKSDVRLDNLELLPRRQLMARNSVHNLPQPLAATIQLLGALNRQVRRRTRDAHC